LHGNEAPIPGGFFDEQVEAREHGVYGARVTIYLHGK